MGASSSSPASSCRRSSAAVHAAAAADRRPSSGESMVSSTEPDRLRNLPPGDAGLLSSLHHHDGISGLILTYLTAAEINATSLTSKAAWCMCDQSGVWLDLCARAGKLSPFLGEDGRTERTYRELYWSTIVVPTEAETIQEAIKRAIKYDKTIVLLPGTHEGFWIHGGIFTNVMDQLRKDASKCLAPQLARKKEDRYRCQRLVARLLDLGKRGIDLTICARDPAQETVVAHHSDGADGDDDEDVEDPTIHITNSDSIPRVKLSLEGLAIRHSVPGSDLSWNAAFRVAYDAELVARQCSITSLTGCGIRTTLGASTSLVGCSVFNCAANALRVKGSLTKVNVEGCNIVGNGYGFGGGYEQIDGENCRTFLERVLNQEPTLGSSVGGMMTGPGYGGIYSIGSRVKVKDSLVTRSFDLNVKVSDSKGGDICLERSDTSLSGRLRKANLTPTGGTLICSIPLAKPRPAVIISRDPATVVVPSKDAPTISEAIKLAIKGNTTIVLLPGVYQESIELSDEMLSRELDRTRKKALVLLKKNGGSIVDLQKLVTKTFDLKENGVNITIRAADPSQATIIAHCSDELSDAMPTVLLNGAFGGKYKSDPSIKLTLEGLHICHSVPGTDIWNLNTAIKAYGSKAILRISNCLVTSVSGRGIVVDGGANAGLFDSTIYNCAATGIYLDGSEDAGTKTTLLRSNVVNNGFGGRPELSPTMITEPLLCSTAVFLESIKSGLDRERKSLVATNKEGAVPSGHSGIYIAAASASLDDVLISTSGTTGISTVRSGDATLNGCDVVCNGSDGVAVEDEASKKYAAAKGWKKERKGRVTFGKVPCQVAANGTSRDEIKATDLFRL